MSSINLSTWGTQGVTQVADDLREFLWKNNLITSIAGFSIGVATKELIEKWAITLFNPTIQSWLLSATYKSLPSWQKTGMGLVADMVLWVIIVFMTFVFAEYIMNRHVLKSPEKDTRSK